MSPKERIEFGKVIMALAALYGREVDEALLLGYEMGLGDMPLDAIRKAATRASRESRFMPTPAELRQLSGDLTPAARATLAWTAADKAVRRIGAYATVQFDDPVTNACIVRMGGWVKFCDLPLDQLGYAQRDFEKLYVALMQNGFHEADASPLIGIIDADNGRDGYEKIQVALIACDLPRLRDGIVRPAINHQPTQQRRAIEHVGRMPE